MEIRSLPLVVPVNKAAVGSVHTETISKTIFVPPRDSMHILFGGIQADKPVDYLHTLREKGVLVSGGGGVMGSGIAINHLNSGIPAALHDVKEAFVQGGVSKIDQSLVDAQKRGLMSGAQVADVRSRLKGTYTNDTIADIPKDTAFVIEAIFENADAKKALFKKLDEHLDENAILATNTSSLSVDELAAATKRPDRFIGLHFFNPPHKNRFIEIVPGRLTSVDTVEKAKVLVRTLGKVPIVCQDSPGFVVNRMLVPLMNEGVRLYDEWVVRETDDYQKKYGEAPPVSVRQKIEKTAATTIEQAAREVLWPTFSKKPEVAGMLLGPFSGLNRPEYMGLIGEIGQVFEKGLGEAYMPADTVLAKARAYSQLRRNDPEFSQKFAALQFSLGGPQDVDTQALAGAKDRLTGLMIGVATQLLDEKAASPEDINRGVMLATRWETSPFELINKLGSKRALALVEAYAKTNPAFKVSDTLKTLAKKDAAFPLDYVQSRKEGSTQIITINKPQRYNALDAGMLAGLSRAFKAAEKDRDVKTIVFESIGGKHFVSGADLPSLVEESAEIARNHRGNRLPKGLAKAVGNPLRDNSLRRHGYRFVKQGYELMNDIAASKKVTVAKVNGTALGGGTELSLACDHIVAAEEARFGLPEEKYGIYPAWGGTEFLKRRVGTPLAAFMVHEGGLMDDSGKGPAILSAREALDIGLVDKVVSAAELDRAVSEALTKGEFANKRERKSAAEVDAQAEARVTPEKNARLARKLLDYKQRFVGDLMKGELLAYTQPPAVQERLKQLDEQLKIAREKLDTADTSETENTQQSITVLNHERETLHRQARKLETIYRSVIDLADRRVRSDSSPSRLQLWKDINRLLINMQKLDRARKTR